MREKIPNFRAMIKDLTRAIAIVNMQQLENKSTAEAYESRVDTLEKMIVGAPISKQEHDNLLLLPALRADWDVTNYPQVVDSIAPKFG